MIRSASRALQLASRYVDHRLGVDTSRKVGVSELGLDPARCVEYAPSRWNLLRGALPQKEVSRDDVFVDLGSGKGRVIFEAARHYPFRRIIGVELAPELNAIAADNLRRFRGRLRCTDVELVNADATEWMPPDDLTIAYMFNPFKGDAFSAAVSNLVDLVDRRGWPLRVIYANPKEHARLMQAGRVQRLPARLGLRYRLLGIPDDWVRYYAILPKR
jgi:SAM-dependent methyltransferase